MAKLEQIQVPKEFYIAERDRFYANWSSSFWRELFQNSIDAGSSLIDITIENVPGKGSFGRAPRLETVSRVRFSDNGVGMDEDVLRNVYFRPGETTKKDGSSVGGYGRARLMTCFSQVRYAIFTQDRIVEGDGPEFTCMPLQEAIAEKRRALEQAPTAESRERIVEDLAELEARPLWLPGCELEIDVNPNEYPDRPWKNVGREVLLDTLREYLSQSQLYINGSTTPLQVNVNGVPWDQRLSKGKAIRNLTVELEDGRDVQMGTVHANKSPRAPWRGNILFRIEGAPMMRRSISSDVQLIVELDKAHSREFLTSNRDALKPVYNSVVDDFLDEVLLDYKTALEDRDEITHQIIRGGRGDAIIAAESPGLLERIHDEELTVSLSSQAPSSADLHTSATSERPTLLDALRENVEEEIYDKFVGNINKRRPTFLDEYDNLEVKRWFEELVRDEGFERAFETAPQGLKSLIVKQLVSRSHEARKLLKEVYNIHIRMEKPTSEIRKAMRRYNPRNWDANKGYGGDAMALHAAWQACCKHAVTALMRVAGDDPELAGGKVKIATGWLFKPSEEQFYRSRNGRYRTEALHTKVEDTHVLLLNPITDEGKRAFKLSDDDDIQKLMTLALHEAVHICAKSHDSYWSELMTKVVMAFDFQKSGKVSRDVREAISRARDIFRSGKSHVQCADPTPAGQLRPWERLVATSAPTATMAAGLMAAQENHGAGDSSLASLYHSCFSEGSETGTVVIDCDRLNVLDRKLGQALASSRLDSQLSARADSDEPEETSGPAF